MSKRHLQHLKRFAYSSKLPGCMNPQVPVSDIKKECNGKMRWHLKRFANTSIMLSCVILSDVICRNLTKTMICTYYYFISRLDIFLITLSLFSPKISFFIWLFCKRLNFRLTTKSILVTVSITSFIYLDSVWYYLWCLL